MQTQKRAASKREGAGKDGLPSLEGMLNVSEIQTTCWGWGGDVADYYISSSDLTWWQPGWADGDGKFWKFICSWSEGIFLA